MTKQYAFYFDASACTGCKACYGACQDKNSLAPDLLWRRIYVYGGGTWMPQGSTYTPNNVFAYSMSISCMHCETAPCVSVCPAGAMTKRADGIVLVDANQCIGCRYCQWACPYGAPQFDETKGVMTKCNFCQDLLAQGQNPACVDACPQRAIESGELADLRAKHGNLNAIEPLPAGSITNPSFVVTPHKHAQLSGKGTGRIMNPEEV